MKPTVITMLSMVLFINGQISGQNHKPHVIPSFIVLVETSALFQETTPSNSDGKRVIHVHINAPQQSDTVTCYANVLIYSLNHQSVLGPYRVLCGETLSVEIDNREWGVSITTNNSVLSSVWIDSQGFLNKLNCLPFQAKDDEFCKPD